MVVDIDASEYDCEHDGTLVYKCSYDNCNHTTSENMVATGHKFQPESGESTWETKIPATCYSEGLRVRKCVNPKCTVEGGIEGAILGENGEYTYLDDINQMRLAKVAHVLDTENAEVVAPTASAQGYTRTKCVNYEQCGHYVDSDFVAAQSDFEFVEEGDGYRIVGYSGDYTEITIPATFNGKPVLGIDSSVFGDWQYITIGKLIIESDNIFMSGDYGIFSGAIIEEVVLKSGVTCVPGGTFEGATITTITCENADVVIEDSDNAAFGSEPEIIR